MINFSLTSIHEICEGKTPGIVICLQYLLILALGFCSGQELRNTIKLIIPEHIFYVCLPLCSDSGKHQLLCFGWWWFSGCHACIGSHWQDKKFLSARTGVHPGILGWRRDNWKTSMLFFLSSWLFLPSSLIALSRRRFPEEELRQLFPEGDVTISGSFECV